MRPHRHRQPRSGGGERDDQEPAAAARHPRRGNHARRAIWTPRLSLAGFETKLRNDGALAVTYKTEASSVEGVLAAVRAAGVQIKDLSTEDPDLEDVFLALTYGDPGAQNPTRD